MIQQQTVDAAERKRREEDRWELCMCAWLAMRHYPQYRDAHRGDEWKLVRVVRRVQTKAGLSFSAGEETIAKQEGRPLEGRAEVVAWSFHTRVDTVLHPSDVVWLTQ